MKALLIIGCLVLVGCAIASPSIHGPEMDTEKDIAATLDRLNALLSAHDPAIVQEFAPDADVLLLGSEANELAIGPSQLGTFFRDLLSQPFTLSWEWKQTRVSSMGNVAWVFAEGDVIVLATDGTTRAPYRLTGVLEHRNGKWLWRQSHGSEPAKH